MSAGAAAGAAGPARTRGAPLRRLAAPASVGLARVRAHPGRTLLVVAGVAAAAALVEGVLGASLVMRDRVLERTLAALPAGDRTIRVDAFGLAPRGAYRAGDRAVRAALAEVSPRRPVRGELFRELRIGGELVRLAGVSDLRALVRLTSGRLPRSCTPARCEVAAIGGGRAAWRAPGLSFVRVGTGRLASTTVFGDALGSSGRDENGNAVAVLVAPSLERLDALPALAGIFRSYSWVDPLEARHVHLWDVAGILARESRAQAVLARAGDVYRLQGPDDALLAARSRGRVAAERMVLLGGELGTVVLGFALLCALGLRGGIVAERRRLLARGATLPQAWAAAAVEVGTLTLAGVALGVAAGALAVGLTGGRDALAHSIATRWALALAAASWLGATLAALAVTRIDEEQPRRRVRLVDVAALGAVAAVALGFSRGGLGAGPATSGDTVLLLLVPVLACFACAVLATRALGPLVRAGERTLRHGPLAARLALLSLARARAQTLGAVAFVLVAVALALFAVSYRATLSRSAADQAAFAVPLDVAVAAGAATVDPLEAAPLARYRALAPGVQAYPVLRQSATVSGAGSSELSPTVLGVPPQAVARLRWRPDFAAVDQPELARRLAAQGPARLRGVAVPAGARVALDVLVRGVPVALDLVGEGSAGEPVRIPLGERGRGAWRLEGAVPRGVRLLVGLEVAVAEQEQVSLAHREAEGELSAVPGGTLRLGPLRSGGRTLTDWRGWLVRGASLAAGRAPRLSYDFTSGETVLLRRRQATDGRPLDVVASPEVARAAGPGGLLTLDFQETEVPARVVAVASRFPDAERQGEGFVVAAESRLATALEADVPGAGVPGEVWVSVPERAAGAVDRALRRPPFAALAVSSRSALERQLRSDPPARAVGTMLGLAALLCLALAATGFWVALVSDLRDGRRALFDLEAQGAPPALLRGQLRLRSAVTVGLGTLGGVGLGLLLSRLAVALVRISSGGEAPTPPLRFEPDWKLVGAGSAGFLVAVALVLEAATRRFFAGDGPGRAAGEIE